MLPKSWMFCICHWCVLVLLFLAANYSNNEKKMLQKECVKNKHTISLFGKVKDKEEVINYKVQLHGYQFVMFVRSLCCAAWWIISWGSRRLMDFSNCDKMQIQFHVNTIIIYFIFSYAKPTFKFTKHSARFEWVILYFVFGMPKLMSLNERSEKVSQESCLIWYWIWNMMNVESSIQESSSFFFCCC